jgi:DNA polymerase III subunit gamma/tau
MENFVVSARKYRPTTFKSVVGQQHITTTLKNAIKNNHLAQAFLFCGPRGVGKTTCARILAKTINCFNLTDDIEPCNTCESCTSFNDSHSFNVYELDAASNNSVDDIRNLVEQVRFAPQLGKYKVYIIDEVHMLSTAAFNAFLKTLEEPPAHAIFILATTERHKIIPTILSRCQIFDFNRMTIDDIVGHLEYVAKSEGVTAELDALHVIAQKADGAMRDSLSIFDQLVNFTGANLTYKQVIENLNILDYDYYFKVTDFLLKGEIANVLLIFNEILANGFDGHNFISGLGEHLRNLLVSKDPSTLKLLEVGETIKAKYGQQAAAAPQGFILQGLKIINHADLNYKNAKNQRLFVEMALISLCAITGLLADEKKNSITEQQPQALPPVTPPPVNITPTPPTVVNIVAEPLVAQAPPQPKADAPKQETPVAQAPPVSRPQAGRGMPPMGGSSFSITQRLNKEFEKKEEESNAHLFASTDGLPQTDFTADRLINLWESYADAVGAEGKYNLRSILKTANPIIGNGYRLSITVASVTAVDEINREKIPLLEYLRKELNNFVIDLDVNVNTQEKGNLKPYTPAQKFQFLAEKNPVLEKLKQKLDLDVDF